MEGTPAQRRREEMEGGASSQPNTKRKRGSSDGRGGEKEEGEMPKNLHTLVDRRREFFARFGGDLVKE